MLEKAGLPVYGNYIKGMHNLKRTFVRRLRAAGVPLEAGKVLLGHTNGNITSRYSAPEIKELLDATNTVCERSADINTTGKKSGLIVAANISK